jgi:hypothetical protein
MDEKAAEPENASLDGRIRGGEILTNPCVAGSSPVLGSLFSVVSPLNHHYFFGIATEMKKREACGLPLFL